MNTHYNRNQNDNNDNNDNCLRPLNEYKSNQPTKMNQNTIQETKYKMCIDFFTESYKELTDDNNKHKQTSYLAARVFYDLSTTCNIKQNNKQQQSILLEKLKQFENEYDLTPKSVPIKIPSQVNTNLNIIYEPWCDIAKQKFGVS